MGPLGPRPLALHLHLAWLDAVARSSDAFADGPGGVDAAAQGRLLEALAGLRAYWHHPRRETAAAGSVVWQEGACRLLDLGQAGGQPVLVVPSLINRARVLDLAEDRSLVRHLAQAGFRPLLLDWGEPGARERGYAVGDYVRGPAAGALRAAARLGGPPPVLLGYCMGGLLALALATLRPAPVAGLALLATPWDFHAGGERLRQILAAASAPITAQAAAAGLVPVESLQAAFALLDPPRWPASSAGSPPWSPVASVRRRSSRWRTGCRTAYRWPVRRRSNPLALVRGQPAGEGPVAPERPAGPARAPQGPRLPRHPAPRPYRPARLGRGAGRPPAECDRRPARRRPRLHGGRQPPAGGALRAARGLDAAIGSEADRRVRRLPATYYKAQDRSGTWARPSGVSSRAGLVPVSR